MTASRSPSTAALGSGLAAVSALVATALAGWVVVTTLRGESGIPWLLARASGLAGYLLLVALVSTGLGLSHPWSRRVLRPGAETRLTIHVSLATFTLVFSVLHVVVLATDPWAHVGWGGALLPMASAYRPVPVTLGVLALWTGLITGLTARLAGRAAARVWWPVHKVAAAVLVLVWTHSVLTGTDTGALRWFYVSSGVAVLGLAVTRYAAPSPTDRLAELTNDLEALAAGPTDRAHSLRVRQ